MTIGLLDVFSAPPTDGSVALNQLVDYHLETNPDCEFATLVDGSGNEPNTSISYKQLVHAVHHVAHIINPGAALSQGTRVAILTSTDTIVNIALVLGIMRAGLVPFPISPRVSIAGICHLLISTETHYMVSGGGSAISRLVEGVQSSTEESRHQLNTFRLPSYKELFQPHLKDTQNLFPGIKPSSVDTVVAILHSSGSTGLPRPVLYTQECLLSSFINQPPRWQMGGFCARVGLMALPTFHVMGFITQCFFPQFAGFTSVLFAPGPTPVIPSPDVTLRAIMRSACSFLLTVPTFLEAWSHNPEAINQLKKLNGVIYAGGPLIPHAGNVLVEQGVPLRAAYGATEFGAPVRFDLALRAPEDWVYVEFSDYARPELIAQLDRDETYELVMMCTPQHKPFVVNYSNEKGELGYATKDLVVPHPTKPGLLKLVGRVDDQIVLLNGEKTNPVPIEDEIVKCPLVQSAVMFGREQNQTGVLVELDSNQSEPLLGEHRESMIDRIWPYIEIANNSASTHSRIAREAIIFSHASRPLPRTPKGNVARAAATKLYADDIAGMYARLGQFSRLASVGIPVSWKDQGEVQSWLTRCAKELLERELDSSDDLFQQGLDSLTVTLLSGMLKGALSSSTDPEIQQVAAQVSQQTIFSSPSIRQLTDHLLQLLTGSTSTKPLPALSDVGLMDSLIARYTQNMNARPQDPTWSDIGSDPVESVVVTGTTGALGSHLLAQLLSNDKVQRVWAINRPRKAGATIKHRQVASFEDKSLPVELLNHPGLTFLECNLDEDQLGLSQRDYEEVISSATTIIHNAWQVDFNWNLQSFEPNIRGTRHLVDLALNSTRKRAPHLVFTSSISVAGLGLPGRTLREEYIEGSSVTAGFGYGESKYVAERVLEAANTAGLETCTMRLGQLTGDRISGSWSKNDWVPALVASSITVGRLPDAVGTISWLPLDAAARIMLDVCQCSSTQLPPVAHIAHPRPVLWSELMTVFAQVINSETGRNLPFISFHDWNIKITQAAASSDPQLVHQWFPTTRIQASFDGMAKVDQELRGQNALEVGICEVFGPPHLATTVCEFLSPTLRDLPALDCDDVLRWVRYWQNVGLFVRS